MYNQPTFITRLMKENVFQFSFPNTRHTFLLHLLALTGKQGIDSGNGQVVFGGKQ